jgi:Zn-dependent metalloprotease
MLSAAAVIAAGTVAQGAPEPAAPNAAEQHDSVLALARNAVPNLATQLGIGKAEKLVVKDAMVDPNGAKHFRYDRTFDGLRVLGGDMLVHEAPNGKVTSVQKANNAKFALSTAAKQTPAQASRAALNANKAVKYTVEKGPVKVVFAASHSPVLAYETVLSGKKADQTPSRLHVVTDAATGKVLSSRDDIENVAGTGNTEYSGKVALDTTQSGSSYTLTDASRGGQAVYDLKHSTGSEKGTLMTDADNTWGDGNGASVQTAGADAAYGVGETWDFYKNVFKRNGIADDGKGAYSRVHYGNDYENAFWDDSCFCMTYGDGASNAHPLTELDVTGHEMSHGVTAATANLNYTGESGGLNEATSDIFGTAVEFNANNAVDKGDYLIGEELNLNGNGTPLRYMDKPSKDGKSADSWSTLVGTKDVHYSSGVANHLFYLLAEGSGAKTINGVNYDSPTSNGSKVTGIGRDKAEQIWYAALTKYMTSTTNFHSARTATLSAAKDLYGADSTEYKTTDAAWAAVNVTANNGIPGL